MKTTSKKWTKIVSIIVSVAILCTVMVVALVPSFAADDINYGRDSYTLADQHHYASMGVDGINYTFVQTEDNQKFTFRTIYKMMINFDPNNVRQDNISFTNTEGMEDYQISWIGTSPMEDTDHPYLPAEVGRLDGQPGAATNSLHTYEAEVTFTSDKAASRESLVLTPVFTVDYRSLDVDAINADPRWNQASNKHQATFPFTITIIDARSLADTVATAEELAAAKDTYTAESRDALAKAIETYNKDYATQTEVNFAEALILRAVENLETLPGVTVEPIDREAIKADRQAAINKIGTDFYTFKDTGHYVSMGAEGVNYTFIQDEATENFQFTTDFNFLINYVGNSLKFKDIKFVDTQGSLGSYQLAWLNAGNPVDVKVYHGVGGAAVNNLFNYTAQVSFTSDKEVSREAEVIKSDLTVDYKYNAVGVSEYGPFEDATEKYTYTITILDQRPLDETVKEAEQKLARTDLYTEESLALLQESVDLYRDGGITQTEINYAELLIRDAILKLVPIEPDTTEPTEPGTTEPGTTEPVDPDTTAPVDPDTTAPTDDTTPDDETTVPAGDTLPVALLAALAAVAGGAVIVTKKARKDK